MQLRLARMTTRGLRTDTHFVVSDSRIWSASLMPLCLTLTRAWMRMGERGKGCCTNVIESEDGV